MILTQLGASLRLKNHDQFQSGLASRIRLGFERFMAGINGDSSSFVYLLSLRLRGSDQLTKLLSP